MVTPWHPIVRTRSPEKAFTLVEVALAIGIIAFAFVTLLALLPAGNTAYRRAADTAVCGQIAQRVIGDAQQADFATLIDETGANGEGDAVNYSFRYPTRGSAQFRYFDDQGREIIPASSTAGPTAQELFRVIYVVNTRVMTRMRLPQSKNSPSAPKVLAKDVATALVTVQVAHNPQNRVVLKVAPLNSSDSSSNLWVPDAKQAGIDVFTYSAVIARAQ